MEKPEVRRFFETLLGGSAEATRSALVGKVGLALSGGGFRASFYHLGVLARLAELDVLRNVEVLSCVSGGSIVGACYWLALRKQLENPETAGQVDYIELVRFLIDHFERAVAADLRDQVQLSTLRTGVVTRERFEVGQFIEFGNRCIVEENRDHRFVQVKRQSDLPAHHILRIVQAAVAGSIPGITPARSDQGQQHLALGDGNADPLVEFFAGFDALPVKKDPVWRKAQAEIPVQGKRVAGRVGPSVADEDVRHGKFLQGVWGGFSKRRRSNRALR
jgi:hypothetical protein